MMDLLGAFGDATGAEMLAALRELFNRVATPATRPHLDKLLASLKDLTPQAMAGGAFDQAALWMWPDLADEISVLRDRLLPGSPSWSSAPELDTWDRSARWWSRRVALVCLLGMRMEPQHAAGLGAAAHQVIAAPAWRSAEPANRSAVLTLYTWALQQSPIPSGARWARGMLAEQARVAGYMRPSSWDIVKEGSEQGLRDAGEWFKDLIPDEPAEIGGLLLGLGALAGVAWIATVGPTVALNTARRTYAARRD